MLVTCIALALGMCLACAVAEMWANLYGLVPVSFLQHMLHDTSVLWSNVQLEAMEEVERAFVHVDYKSRDVPEHKVERQMHNDAKKARKLIKRRTFL